VRAEGDTGSPLSVVHVCAPAEVGGLERVVQGLSVGLARRGHTVSLIAVVSPGADLAPFFAPLGPAGVRTIAVELPGRAYLRELNAVGRLILSLAPDVMHSHGYRPDLLHGWSTRRKGIATVSTLHGSSRMGGKSHLFEWIQERALRRFDAVVAVSHPLVDSLERRGVPHDRIHHVPNGWFAPSRPLPRDEARARLGLSPGDRVIGWTGRLIPIKGADVFLRALGLLDTPGWVGCVMGDGPERPALEALAEELGIGDRVRFQGAVQEAARSFAAFDAFVLSSRSEGTPMVLLEAMGAGVPVVATEVGGVPWVVEREREGWLVPSEAPDELARALRAALTDPAEAQARAGRARARVERDFAPDVWIRRHEETYRAAIAVRARS
jgi:glycosyltransferase involved in cell wall biosynthesis